MGITLGERYELKKLISPLAEGLLYDARDHALMRDVFLYIVDHKTADRIQLMENIRHVSWIGGDRFFHILNAGSNEEIHYVVLAAQKGVPLMQTIQAHPFNGEQILREVLAIGKSIQDTDPANMDLINVTAENLWYADDGRLFVIDTWSRTEAEKRSTDGLIRLMKQLGHFSLNETGSADRVHYGRAELPMVFQMLPSQVKTKLANLWSSTNEQSLTLPIFLEQLEMIINEAHDRNSMTESPPIEGDSQEYISDHTPEQLPPRRMAATEQLHQEEDDDRSGGMDLSLKIGIITLIVTGLIALFMVWNYSRMNNEPPPDTTLPAAQDETPLDDNEPIQDEEDLLDEPTDEDSNDSDSGPTSPSRPNESNGGGAPSNEADIERGSEANDDEVNESEENESEENEQIEDERDEHRDDGNDEEPPPESNEPNDGATVQVPDLIGMPLAEAEETLLRAGLRYEYFIENSEEESGVVFRQQPEGFIETERGDRVTFWVSR